ncbi:MAG TPA: Rieske (2Fe-2S) protein [Mycobacteriales bacterium]|nr:Rieske (2Fe-2S) protein [Mycobacteriales bacterium]
MPDSTLRRRIDQLGQNTALDRFVEPLRRAVHGALRDQRLADALHGVWLGHPLHPALTDLPIGAWTSAGLLDATGTNPRTAAALVGVGVVSAVPAAAAGLADWSHLHTDQQRVGLVHAAANAVALALYTASLTNRLRGRRGRGRLLGFLGYASVVAGANLGGHLAFRLAAGPNHAERVPWVAPEGWQDVCSLDELPERQPVRHQLGEISVLVARSGSDVYALSGECAHLDGPLYRGELTGWDTEPCVTCPWHGSTYRLRDGQVVRGPATAPQPAIEVRVESGRVLLRAPSNALAGVAESTLAGQPA